MSYPIQIQTGHATLTIVENSNVIAALKNYHGRVMSLFSALPTGEKWTEIAKRILTLISIPLIYPILGGIASINYTVVLLNRFLIHLKCHSVFKKLLGLEGYEVNLELRPGSTNQWDSIKVFISIGDAIYGGHAKRLATLSCIIPSDGINHHPQWFKDQIEQQIPTFSQEIYKQYFPLKMGLPEVTIEVFVKRLNGTFTAFHQSSSGSGGPGFMADFNTTEIEEHFERRFSYIDLPYSPQLNNSFNFQ
jgi:hypothetical protein